MGKISRFGLLMFSMILRMISIGKTKDPGQELSGILQSCEVVVLHRSLTNADLGCRCKGCDHLQIPFGGMARC